MSTKKLSRVVIAVLVMTFVLAVSALADFSLTIDGTLVGLEDGVTYTAAKYDFANNTYGEFTELTDETVLTTGVWGIKAGNAEPTAFFVQGAESGKFNFWNAETGAVANVFKGGTLTDSFVPGFWSVKKGTALSNATSFNGPSYASVCIHLEKKDFLTKVDGQKLVTVTVDKVTANYPVFSIDGTEYYLREDKYYTVKDKTLYEGDGEATPVIAKIWPGATTIEGEANLLAEAEYFYGFTNEQVVPASAVIGYTSGTVAMRVGSVVYKTGYSEQTLGSKVVFYTKTIGSDVVTEYVAETTTAGKFIVTVPSNIPANAYVVAVGFRPYDEAADDTFVNNADNIEDRGYYHHYMNKGDNGLTITPITFDAPTGIKGGYGNIGGLVEGKTYQYATLNVNAAGTALEQGSWTAYTADTTLAGLVVVREVTRYGNYTEPTAPIYVYGDKDARQALCDVNPSTGKIYATGATNTFKLGYWTGKEAATHSSFSTYAVSTLGGGWISDALVSAAKDADENLKADPENEALKATALAKRQALCNAVTNNWLYYGYTSDEIIPVNELEQFQFSSKTRQGVSYSEAYVSEFAVVIAAPNGTVSEYKYYTTAEKDGDTVRTIDFTDADAWTPALPDKGWVVGIKVNQWYGKTDTSAWVISTGFNNKGEVLNAMPTFTFIPEGYKITEPKLVLTPIAADLSGLYEEDGVVKGFNKNLQYGMSKATINGISDDVTLLPEGATSYEIPTGLWTFRVIGDGVSTTNSLPSDVFYSAGNSRGNIIHTEEVLSSTHNGTPPHGTIVDRIIAKKASVTGAVEFVDGVWVATHAYSDNLYTYWTQGSPLNLGSTGNHISTNSLRTAINALAADSENATLKADVAAKTETVVSQTTSTGFAYQFTPDEIIPMTDFVSHTFKAWCRQTGVLLNSGKFQTKYVLKVMLDNGTIVDRVVYKDVTYGYNIGTVMTVSLSDFTETDGYIVGMVIYPYGEAIDVEFKAGGSACNSDVDVMFYEDGYKTKAPAAAPKFEIVAAVGGVNAIVDGVFADASYAWSLDGNTWTNGDEADNVLNIPGAKVGDTVYVKMLAYEPFLESYVGTATVPAFKDVPALTLGEGNVLTVEAGIYEITKFAFNTETVYEPLTEKTLTTGVWGVRTIGDDTAPTSAPQIFYIKGASAGAINYTATKSTSFTAGKWAVPSFSTMYKNSTTWDVSIAEIHGSAPYKLAERREFALRYQFTEDEIVPANTMTDISSVAAAFYHGYVKEGYTKADGKGARAVSAYGQTLARVYVVGAAVPYYDIYTEIKYTDGYKFAIADYLADKEGYVVALELYPLWSIYGADNKTDLGDDCVTALWRADLATPNWGDYTYKLRFNNQFVENELPEGESLPTTNGWANGCYADGTNRFAIRIEKTKAEAPQLSINVKNVITIGNYNSASKYAYSTDGGETWTEFASNTFTATKANAEYRVKVLESKTFYESDVATITSQPIAVVGSSLVLDGQIGVKMYFDVAEDLVKPGSLTFHATKVNSDYAGIADMASDYRVYGYANSSIATKEWLSLVKYDEELDLYYVIVSIPAKDADNTSLETELNYYLADGTTKVVYGSVGASFRVTDYIATAKEFIAAGDANFVAAADLIYATENYLTYADAYFGNKTVDAYKTDATMDVEAATRTNATLEGIQFYGTSLLLEDNVTIRHYFKVTDTDAFVQAGYTCDIDYRTKDGFIYYDIKDIAAQDLGEQFALTIKNAGGTAIYEVKYSATNYMASMANDSNANLASLVNAMYDYYLAAADYAK